MLQELTLKLNDELLKVVSVGSKFEVSEIKEDKVKLTLVISSTGIDNVEREREEAVHKLRSMLGAPFDMSEYTSPTKEEIHEGK